MLQILITMFSFYFIIKGLEFFHVAMASPRENKRGLYIMATIVMIVCVCAALTFCSMGSNQASSIPSPVT